MARARMVVALCFTYLIFAVLLNSVGTVILQSINSLGVTKDDASTLEAFKDLPIAVASFLVGGLLPRLGYRNALVAGLALVGAACLAMPAVGAFWMMKLLFLAIGVSFALVKISVYSTIGLLTEGPREHASLTGVVEGVFMVGVLAGYWAFSLFLDPATPASTGWLRIYWCIAAACALAIAVILASPFDEEVARSHDGVTSGWRAMPELLLLTFVVSFLLCAFLYVLVEQSIGTWLPTFNNQVLRLPAAMSLQASSIFAASLAAGRLLGGLVLQRVRWDVVLTACVVGMALLIVAVIPLAQPAPPAVTWGSAPLAAYLFPLIGAFMAPIYPTINSAVLSALPKVRHAPMTGLIVVFSALGGTLGSFVTGRTFGAIGGQAAFLLALVPLALLLLALMAFKRALERAAGGGSLEGERRDAEPALDGAMQDAN